MGTSNTIYHQGATITPASVSLLVSDSHVINCVFTDLEGQLSSVKWSTSTSTLSSNTFSSMVTSQSNMYRYSSIIMDIAFDNSSK